MGFFELPPGWRKYWKSMPSFDQENLTPCQTVEIHFATAADRALFAKQTELPVTDSTKFTWYPYQGRASGLKYAADTIIPNRHPIYIISKGRWESRLTSKTLESLSVPYHIVVEPQEYENYAAVIDPKKILTLPFSNLQQGSIPARNFVWEHSIEQGAKRHWILDDNIRGFVRYNENQKVSLTTGNFFRATEDLVDRYDNVAISGLNYRFFVEQRSGKKDPITMNTRVYSCILIQNDIPYRWRGRYNEDTDLSIRALKDGWCTMLFNAFLAEKIATMSMKGGNTDELYKGDGRLQMAQSLKDQHPDIVKVSRKWGRWQHHVDYSRFARNKLIPNKTFSTVSAADNNYGMYLINSNAERSS